ncbi:MAG: ABC transporter permease [Nitrososphaerota archaeon]|jgi:putative ABC transport system permease protein|uniref:ABC transporter permease n=1 Tax=Candidatus Bathycorpusculum sp. TaxID=2994959 RepID=UPI0028273DCB|nr:ABC transporter permease [Candidatus Termitimicrobium sp.]MDR0493505.1 ABC transporter permease [Nitrososphaerota archaeon]
MKTRDIFGYAFSAIKLRKLRAALTTLGVIVGIAAIVALLSITQGLQATITGELNQGLAANILIVTPSSGSNDGGLGGFSQGSSSTGFSLYSNYTTEINALSPDIEMSIAVMSRSGRVQSGDFNRSATLYGVDFNDYATVYPTFKAGIGSIPTNPLEIQVVVGTRINQPTQNGTIFFNAGNLINVSWINATTLPPVEEKYTAVVAGVLDKVGGFGIGGPSDTGVYIPIEKAQSFFGTDQCDMIIVTLKNSDNATITNVSKAITEHFSNQVTVIAATTVLGLLSTVFSTLQLFLGGIAAISLLVAGIGIMNIMIVSLIERTREIGILKALGMKSRSVLAIFLGESVIIGLIGASVGIALGWGLAVIVAQVLGSGAFSVGGGGGAFNITPLLTPEVFVGALIFGVGVSVIFALYPAWRASKLKPVDALRYE